MSHNDDIVWEIGPERNPLRFNASLLKTEGEEFPDFEIGVSDEAVAWPRTQPGPLNASTGFSDISVGVSFDIDDADAAEKAFELELDLLEENGPCPELLLDVNGTQGLVTLTSRRDDRSLVYALGPVAGHISRRVQLPVGAVTPGRNRLVITTTALDRPDPSELVEPYLPMVGIMFGSTLTWRRLALRQVEAVTAPQTTVRPLPLFVRTDDGLRELVDVVVAVTTPVSGAAASLTVDGQVISKELDLPVPQFGDLVIRLEVPDLGATMPAEVTVTIDGETFRTTFDLRPAGKWNLHLIPHVHLDLGYSDFQGKTDEVQNRNLDRTVDILRHQPDFTNSIDGSYVLDSFTKTRSPEALEDVVRAIRSGNISVNSMLFSMLTGVSGLEDLYRAMYGAADFARREDLQVGPANLTDVPSYSSAMPSIFAAAGVNRFMGIVDHYHGGNADSEILHMESPVRWLGPDGAEVLTAFTDCYTQLRYICADPPTVVGMATSLTRYIGRYERDDYLPRDLPILGTHADNEDLGEGYADVVARWNERYAYPAMRFSTIADYFDAVEPLQPHLPVITGDGGSYWEDAAGTQAIQWGRVRMLQELLPATEALGGLVSCYSDRVRANTASFDEAWRDILIADEHTWGAWSSILRPDSEFAKTQFAWKCRYIEDAWHRVNDEALRGLSQLGELLAVKGASLIVFNPTSRTRDVAFEVELGVGAELVRADDTLLPLEALAEAGDGMQRVTGTVTGMAPFGFEVLRIVVPADGPGRPSWETTGELAQDSRGTIETAHYRVTIDQESGRVQSLFHLKSGRELLDPSSPYGFGDLIYVSGGGDAATRGTGEHQSSFNHANPYLPRPVLAPHRAELRCTGVAKVPGGSRIRLEGSAPSMPAVTIDLRFIDDEDRVDLTVTVYKESETAKESVYVAFPFASTSSPQLRYDRHLSWVDPATESLPGAGVEWFACQNGISAGNEHERVVLATVDAPLFTSSEFVRGDWPTTFEPANNHVYSWILNNLWPTNTPASQEGTAVFRYAIWPTGVWDETEASVLVRDFRAPTLVTEIVPQDYTRKRPAVIDQLRGAMIDVSADRNVDVKIYASRRGTGVLLRIASMSSEAGSVTVLHPHGSAGRAYRCSAVEDPLEPLAVDADGRVTVTVGPYEVRSVVLHARNDGQVAPPEVP